MINIFSPEQHLRKKLELLGEKLDQHYQQHLLLRARLEENRKSWFRAVREYEDLERKIKAMP